MRLPGKFFIAAWQRQSARWSEAVCPLHVYTLLPVAFVHWVLGLDDVSEGVLRRGIERVPGLAGALPAV